VNRGTTHTIRREVTPTAMAYPVAGAEMNSKTIIVDTSTLFMHGGSH
jgi:hypothetical protein